MNKCHLDHKLTIKLGEHIWSGTLGTFGELAARKISSIVMLEEPSNWSLEMVSVVGTVRVLAKESKAGGSASFYASFYMKV